LSLVHISRCSHSSDNSVLISLESVGGFARFTKWIRSRWEIRVFVVDVEHFGQDLVLEILKYATVVASYFDHYRLPRAVHLIIEGSSLDAHLEINFSKSPFSQNICKFQQG
jgi:hypothetical protein